MAKKPKPDPKPKPAAPRRVCGTTHLGPIERGSDGITRCRACGASMMGGWSS